MEWVCAAEAATGGQSGGYWQLALMLAAIGFLGLFARWRKARQPPVETAREIRRRDTDPNRYRDTADRAIVELLETSRTLSAQVDTKIRLLNRLVKDSGEQCERLEKLIAEARAVDAPAKPASTRSAPANATPFDGDAPAEGEETVLLPPEPKFLSELHERIFRLRREGRSVAEIAKSTNLSTTEVEFIVQTF